MRHRFNLNPEKRYKIRLGMGNSIHAHIEMGVESILIHPLFYYSERRTFQRRSNILLMKLNTAVNFTKKYISQYTTY